MVDPILNLDPPVTLAIAGDVMLGRLVNDSLRERGWHHPWGDLAPLLWSADAFLINLECAITSRVVRWHDGHYKPFHFRADPAAVETLRRARVDFASIANNHIGDFGSDGLLDTVAALDAVHIAHAGAGRDLAAARAPAFLKAGGLRVAVIAYADYPAAWAATYRSPGLNYASISTAEADFAPIAQAIGEARNTADLVIFSIHWGPNMRTRPPNEFRHFAHRVIDHGVTIFWGHSAHVVQGVELRDHGLILYDTGDFVDDYAVDETLRNDLSALFLIHVGRHEVQQVEIVPVLIHDKQVNLAAGEDRVSVVNRLDALSRELGSSVVAEADGRIRAVAVPEIVTGVWQKP